MTAAETVVMIEELGRRDLTQAWHIAILSRTDPKKFPKSLDDLLGTKQAAKPDGDRSIDVLVAQAKALRRAKERQDKRPDRTILRPEEE